MTLPLPGETRKVFNCSATRETLKGQGFIREVFLQVQ